MPGCDAAVGPEGPPQVTIVSPLATATFAGGDVITVQAAALDGRGRTMPRAAIEWWVVLHHGEHTHPARSPETGSAGTFTVSRQGHLESDIFYRFYARAMSGSGQADTAFVDVAPRVVALSLSTLPEGLEVLLDGQPRVTPFTISAVVGMERTLGVVEPQALLATSYEFASWSHGGALQQTIVVPASDIAVVANFREAGVANIPPAVTVTAPVSGAIVTAGSAVTLQAMATDADGSIATVDFFANGTHVGQDVSAPFAFQWTPSGSGSRSITARAIDDDGAYVMSAAVAVTVQAAGGGDVLAPTTTLATPTNGTLNLSGAIGLSATASDNVAVTAVEFAVDGETLAIDATAPYEATLASTSLFASGVHVLRARAQDQAGNWSDWSSVTVTFSGDVALPAGFIRDTHAGPFGDVLTAAALTPDGRMLVAEKSGRLRVVKNGQLLPQPFVQLDVQDGGERGLLGVAVHPSFATNRYVYLYYTTSDAGVAHNRISRFVADGDQASAGSETILAELPPASDAAKHNGGAIQFGPDGKLYVAVGDDGNAINAPSLELPFGKMLRLNADGSIPFDNPFLSSTTGINRAIWARGLRNPFTFAFEPGTGRLHINDVGAAAWEEVNLGRAGADYGWPGTEGPTTNPAYDTPLLAYAHENSPTLFDGLAVVGAAFYRPTVASFGSNYVGNYFFADYVKGWVYRLDTANDNAVYAFAQIGGFPTGLLVSPAGELYVLVGTRIDRIRRQ